MLNYTTFAASQPTQVARVARAYGTTRAIQTTLSNGCIGLPMSPGLCLRLGLAESDGTRRHAHLLFSVTGIPTLKSAPCRPGRRIPRVSKAHPCIFSFFSQDSSIQRRIRKRGHAMKTALRWAERGLLPDALIRTGIRKLLSHRIAEIDPGDCQDRTQHLQQFIAAMDESPIALHTREANEQHYELPPAFFEKVLGAHLKYSSCYYPTGKRRSTS